MTPMREELKKKILEDAAKAFPDKTKEGLEYEFNEYQGLLSKRLMNEPGKISKDDQDRLDQLHKQFAPFINGPRNQ